jgi:hypothetical protein
VTAVSGRLVPVDSTLRADRATEVRVARMQRSLERDPQYAPLFAPIGKLTAPLSIAALADRTLAVMRAVTKADVALSTSSSFRQPLPAGTLTPELLQAALPYDNEIVTCTMSGAQLQKLLDYDKSRRGTDAESFISGAEALKSDRDYVVATTDYLAFVAYKDAFTCDRKKTGVRVRGELQKALATAARP